MYKVKYNTLVNFKLQYISLFCNDIKNIYIKKIYYTCIRNNRRVNCKKE